ncbi:prepilin peptidase [Campylobacter curvus]|uniref:prepilin peptidase n=1 Tax=Campylobacter curvus TaxID=200 RepID=UPI001470222E|nr:A24 family peptidase [Campylobacter curvus]
MDIYDGLYVIWGLFFLIFGICVGSFSNVLIYRLPRAQSVNFPSSHCTKCGKTLKFYHNIPLLSWLFLRGRCAFCKAKISPTYPLVEATSGALMLLCFYKECGDMLNIQTLVSAVLLGLCFIMLLALSLIDIKFKAVPDVLLFTALGFALIYAAREILWFGDFSALINAFGFAFGFWLLRLIVSAAMKKEAMGSADIFIAAIIGAVLPLKLALFAVYLAAILTLPVYALVRKSGYELAFVPFLSAGLVVTYVFDTEILNFIEMLYE